MEAPRKIKGSVLKDLVTHLTGSSYKSFIKDYELDMEAIEQFKNNREVKSIIFKLNCALEREQNKVQALEEANYKLDRELSSVKGAYAKDVRALNLELKRIKETDPVERKKEIFKTMLRKRDILDSNILPGIVVNSIKNINDLLDNKKDADKNELLNKYSETEQSLIDSYMEILKSEFEYLPQGTQKLDSMWVNNDLNPILFNMQECRTRLSYVIPESEFISFLNSHIKELLEVLFIFTSKLNNTGDLSLLLSPYEQGLLFYQSKTENYLDTYESFYNTQKRILIPRVLKPLSPFSTIPPFPSSYLYCQPEDIIRMVLFTSNDSINNIVFIRNNNADQPTYDQCTYYRLEKIVNKEKVQYVWRMDPFLISTIRLLMLLFNNTAIPIFKRFYKDVFSHNKYILDWEKIVEAKNINRWKSMKVLYENALIFADEYMVGEIARKIIRQESLLVQRETDILQGISGNNDLKHIRERWKQGLAPFDYENEEHYHSYFDRISEWNPEMTKPRYTKRWEQFIKDNKVQCGY